MKLIHINHYCNRTEYLIEKRVAHFIGLIAGGLVAWLVFVVFLH